MIMEMACKIENMMNMLYKLCWQADQGQDVRILAGMAKYYCSKATCEVVDDAIQVLAGAATTSTSAAPVSPAGRIRLWCSTPLRRSSSATARPAERVWGGPSEPAPAPFDERKEWAALAAARRR